MTTRCARARDAVGLGRALETRAASWARALGIAREGVDEAAFATLAAQRAKDERTVAADVSRSAQQHALEAEEELEEVRKEIREILGGALNAHAGGVHYYQGLTRRRDGGGARRSEEAAGNAGDGGGDIREVGAVSSARSHAKRPVEHDGDDGDVSGVVDESWRRSSRDALEPSAAVLRGVVVHVFVSARRARLRRRRAIDWIYSSRRIRSCRFTSVRL